MPTSPKLFHARHSPWLSPVRRTALSVVVFVCGLAGIAFGIVAIFSNGGHRCSVGELRSISVRWESGSGNRVAGESRVGGGVEKRKLLGFVGIQTGFGSAGRRRSLRKTWLPSDREGLQRLEETTGLALRFVIGRTADSSKMAALGKEIEEYDDFMLLDIEEKYSNLPHKTLAFFKASFAAFEADFYVKADDDIYLRPDRLSLLLAKDRSNSKTYLGCFKKGPVFTDPNLKWYEPLSNLLGKEYFLHAYGPIYALSADVVSSLAAFKNDSLRMFTNEDVTVGAWMLAMNVNHEHVSAFCEKECTPSSIAVWDIPTCSGLCNPEKKLLSLDRLQSCSGS